MENYGLSYRVYDKKLDLRNIGRRPLLIELPKWGERIWLAVGESQEIGGDYV